MSISTGVFHSFYLAEEISSLRHHHYIKMILFELIIFFTLITVSVL